MKTKFDPKVLDPEKLLPQGDVDPEEADRIYSEIREGGGLEWLEAVKEALKSGRKGNFVTSVPVFCPDDRNRVVSEIRSLLDPEDRISGAFVMNINVPDTGKRPGVIVKRRSLSVEIRSKRLGIVSNIIGKRLYEEKSIYPNHIAEMLKSDRVFLSSLPLEHLSDYDLSTGKIEFLRQTGIPVVLVRDDFNEEVFDPENSFMYEYDCAFLKECDISRRVSALGPKSLLATAERYGIREPKEKDAPQILIAAFNAELRRQAEEKFVCLAPEDDSWTDIVR